MSTAHTYTKCLASALVLPVLFQPGVCSAGNPGQEVAQFIILVHPCPYEALGKADSDPYRALERAACQRWFDAIPALPPTTFAIEVDFPAKGPSPDKLHQSFIDRLGPGRVCRLPCQMASPEDPETLRGYYSKNHQQISQQLADQELTYDPETCKASVWGQSFEGCAAGFGSAIASGLGLKIPTEFPYAMSAPDAPFLLNATFVQNIAVPDSDVQAYLFDLNDGRCAAFFRACLTPQWLDHRPIVLALDATRFSVLTKQGDLAWPNGIVPTPDQQVNTRYNQWRTVVWPEGTPLPGPHTFALATVQERFVVTATTHMQELIALIGSATVNSR